TRSAWPAPSACTSRPSAPARCRTRPSRRPSTRSSTCARRPSSKSSICCVRSTRRPPPTGTSAANCPTSPGSAPTAPKSCAALPASEAQMAPGRRIARVLIDSPLPQLDRLFDYALPDEFGDIEPGVRVKAPLRTAGRVVDGYIVEIDVEPDASRTLSEIESVVSPVVVMPDRLYRLARKAADRAAGSASDILRLAIPKRQVRVEKAWSPPGPPPVPAPEAVARAHEEIAAYDGLDTVLAESGRAAVEAIPVERTGHPGWAMLLASTATVRLAEGRSSILVVPDYRDQELLLAALGSLVADEAVVRHDARQPNPDRYRAFLRTLEDAPCIVVGNR